MTIETPDEAPTLFDASEGGKARARKLSPERRAEISRRAAESRWDKTIPRATYTGAIEIGERRIECAVLPDGTRVLSQGTVMAALDRATKSGVRRSADVARRAPFLSANNLDPFIPAGLNADLEPIRYRLGGQQFISTGYRAETLPKVLEVYLSARQAGVLQESQLGAAQAAEVLMRALAQVGITALVDEATGYQEVRARDELQQLLSKYVSETFRRWVSVFPNEFFRELYRLYGWDYKEGKTKHPQYIGKFINDHIYRQLPEGVHAELEKVNPRGASGHRPRKHHQHLTVDTGIEHLDKQILTVVTLLQVSDDLDQFRALFDRRFPTQAPRQVLRVTETDDHGFITNFIDDWLDDQA
ncbi:P63C domain-containing protein [Microbacterium sp. LjRoot45]|uniref:P63C domain-containing protein n=1 Tax=Microbacterium sp. LjRoot45 TaxID=3342329 RepID=UPI003ECD4062